MDIVDPIEILRRNARLRAWRAYGVPVEGRWEKHPETQLWRLRFCCLSCYPSGEVWWRLGNLTPAEREEHAVVSWVAGSVSVQPGRPCPHLGPLLCDEDPDEVKAITELELLAGH